MYGTSAELHSQLAHYPNALPIRRADRVISEIEYLELLSDSISQLENDRLGHWNRVRVAATKCEEFLSLRNFQSFSEVWYNERLFWGILEGDFSRGEF